MKAVMHHPNIQLLRTLLVAVVLVAALLLAGAAGYWVRGSGSAAVQQISAPATGVNGVNRSVAVPGPLTEPHDSAARGSTQGPLTEPHESVVSSSGQGPFTEPHDSVAQR